MATKKLVIEFTFEEEIDEDDPEYTTLELSSIKRTHSDLDASELGSLGEEIAQSDCWQVDRWNDLQLILGHEPTDSIDY